MVSYRQLPSGQVVLHERETTSSGRPKAGAGRPDEDQYYYYQWDQRGGQMEGYPRPKTPLQSYAWWHKYNVKFNEQSRTTPLSEFEKKMGVSMSAKPIKDVWYKGRNFSEAEWEIYHNCPTGTLPCKTDSKGNPVTIDYGNVEYYYSSDLPTKGTAFSSWGDYFIQKAKDKDLIVVGSIEHLNFKEKPNPAIIEKIPTPARPNPKEESIASVKIEKSEPIEVEPIKEVVKYSPLMIAGVIAVVVILLLKRRRA